MFFKKLNLGARTVKDSTQSDYLIEVTRGNVPGQKIVSIFGNNSSIDANTEETIWDQGGLYTYLTSNTTLYASSSNAGDTMAISITGLDEDYTEITRTVTLNGQNQVALSGQMFRVFSAFVPGSSEPAGDIYIAESDDLTGGVPDTASKIKAKIVQGKNETQSILYTVPVDKTAYIIAANFLAAKGVDVCFSSKIREFGNVFREKSSFDLYQNSVIVPIEGFKLPEKTDVEVTGTASNAVSSASVRFTYLVIDD